MHVCVYVHCVLEEIIRSSGPGVTEDYELPCGCWELNSGPLQEQQVLLTTEPPFQPPVFSKLKHYIYLFIGWVRVPVCACGRRMTANGSAIHHVGSGDQMQSVKFAPSTTHKLLTKKNNLQRKIYFGF